MRVLISLGVAFGKLVTDSAPEEACNSEGEIMKAKLTLVEALLAWRQSLLQVGDQLEERVLVAVACAEAEALKRKDASASLSTAPDRQSFQAWLTDDNLQDAWDYLAKSMGSLRSKVSGVMLAKLEEGIVSVEPLASGQWKAKLSDTASLSAIHVAAQKSILNSGFAAKMRHQLAELNKDGLVQNHLPATKLRSLQGKQVTQIWLC